jgi:adenosylmethionine-8-amino-7-oxononanoate aminotransferase
VKKHSSFLNEMKGHQGIIDIRQTGTIIAMELRTKDGTSYLNSFRDKIYNYFISKKIILRPLGNIIYILPPYCISDNDLDYIYNCIKAFLEEQK